MHWRVDLKLCCDFCGFRDCRVVLLCVVDVGACFVAIKVSRPPSVCYLK